jgi:hypothetical protein
MKTSILELDRIKKMMGLITESETQKSSFTSNDLRNNRVFKTKFLEIAKRVFGKTGNWGTADNPKIDCYTNEGVINIYTFTDYSKKYNVPNSNWSLINFFNTNRIILDELIKMFDKTTLEKTIDNFLLFLEEFFETKLNTKEFEDLVLTNLRMLKKGINDEVFTFKELTSKLKIDGELMFCPGSKKDTRKGIDFVLTKNDKIAKFQVKPFLFINEFPEATNIIVKDYPQKGYSKKDVDYLIFKKDNTLYIMENDIVNIKTVKTKFGTELKGLLFKSLPLKLDDIVFK